MFVIVYIHDKIKLLQCQNQVTLTLINAGGGGGVAIINPCREYRDFSETEHPIDLRPVCKFEFVPCGPVETNQSALCVSVSVLKT